MTEKVLYNSYHNLTLECERVGGDVRGKLINELPDCISSANLHLVPADGSVKLHPSFNDVHKNGFVFSAEHQQLIETETASLLFQVCDHKGIDFDFFRSGPDILKKEKTFRIHLEKKPRSHNHQCTPLPVILKG